MWLPAERGDNREIATIIANDSIAVPMGNASSLCGQWEGMMRRFRVADASGIFCSVALSAAACVTAPASAQSSATTYQYDALGRLTQVQATDAKVKYAYDAASNRSSVQTQRQFDTSWEAEALPHATGYAEYSGWAADITKPQAYMTYGPYITSVPVGVRTATWKMMVDDSTFPNPAAVVILDVNDATANQVLASRSLTWTSFAANWSYQVFELPFTMDASRAGHMIEFRTYYMATGHINVDRIGYY